MTMARTIKLYKVPEHPQLVGMREMEEKDVQRVYELVTGYLKKFPLHPEFEKDEIAHWILPREGVVHSFVRENQNGEVTDVCSFCSLPSSILGHEKYTLLKAAYSYWNVATTVPLHELMYDALIFAKQHDFDVFNALNVMENESFLKELKFGIGDGFCSTTSTTGSAPRSNPVVSVWCSCDARGPPRPPGGASEACIAGARRAPLASDPRLGSQPKSPSPSAEYVHSP